MITKTLSTGQTVLRADEGKWLVKGESYSNTDVYLGIHDAASNWTEQDAPPPDPITTDPEAVIAEMEGLL
jgi:hypothetical protein